MTVKIYLRSIVKNGEKHLAMFDSKRNGAIDNLTTDVPQGAEVIWKLDYCSMIKTITKIYLKNQESNIFKSDPKKRLLCKGFQVQISESAELYKEEAYTIEFILRDKYETKVVIDPCIRPIPPDTKK